MSHNKNRLPIDYQEQERGGSPELRHLSGRRKTLFDHEYVGN